MIEPTPIKRETKAAIGRCIPSSLRKCHRLRLKKGHPPVQCRFNFGCGTATVDVPLAILITVTSDEWQATRLKFDSFLSLATRHLSLLLYDESINDRRCGG